MKKSLTNYTSLIRSKIAEWERMGKCSRCLMPERFRNITFTPEGVCNYCNDYRTLTAQAENREAEMLELIESYCKKVPGNYQAIVCYSGGKDSTYLLDRFRNTYGLSVLAVTMDSGFMSDLARENIDQTVRVRVTPSDE